MYYSDKPITCTEEDLLNRKSFAKLIAKALVDLNNADTFTVGLYGKWGNGKTSLVNMLIQEIYNYQQIEDEVVIVHFEPWNFSNTNQLLEQFFVHLINQFRDSKDKKLAEVGDALEKYSGAFEAMEVIPYVGGLLSLFGKKGAETLGNRLKKGIDEKDIMKQKDNVIRVLQEQKKKILIVIDDIDRLNNEQIRQIFQLITSVAKFPNTTYLLVFDKEIVVKALEKVQEGNGEEYLEKIIQMPIQIPDIQRGEFRQVLFNRLSKIITAQGNVMFDEEHWKRMYESCVEPLVGNLRDINRLCNSVQFKLAAMASDVDFTDLVIISALEITYPHVFEWVKNNKCVLTGAYDISLLGLMNKSQKEQYDYYFSNIENSFNDNHANLSEIERVMEILSKLFPYFGKTIGKTFEMYDLDLFRKNNYIAHPEKFDRYFNLNVDYINLRTMDVLNAIYNMGYEELASYINELDAKEISYEFLEEIHAAIPDISSDRAGEIINAIFLCTYKLDMVTNKSILSTSSKQYAEMLVLDLFEKVKFEERYEFWEKIILKSDKNTLPTVAQVINMLELAYGRISSDGVVRGFKKVITLDELLELEKQFVIKVKDILEEICLFEFSDYRMVLHLMENYEPEYITQKLDEAFQSDKNVLMFLSNTISNWIGSGVSYEVFVEYEKHLKKERILDAIQNERKNKGLFELPLKVQQLSAVFYLNEVGESTYNGHVSQTEVNDLLDEWKEE